MPLPKVGIIILAYHNSEALADLGRCFTSLERVDYPRDRWEIIVVDNPSPSGECRTYLEKNWLPRSGQTLPRVYVVKPDRNLGFTGGNNVGFLAATLGKCDYVYLLNQDTDVAPDFLSAAVSRAESDSKVGLVQSLLLLGKERDRVNSMGNAFHFFGHSYCGGYRMNCDQAVSCLEAERSDNPDLEIPTASGAALLARTAAIQDVNGLFDEKFFLYHEDVDLSLRMRLRGWKVVIEPVSRVWHHYQFSRSISKYRWMERNRLVTVFSFYRKRTLALLALPLIAVDLISLATAFKGGWLRQKLEVYADFLKLSTWRWILERRQEIQTGRALTDREFLKDAEARILFQEEGMQTPFVTKFANPLMSAFWKVAYAVIRW